MFIPDFGLGRRLPSSLPPFLPPSLRYKMGGKEEETKDRREGDRECIRHPQTLSCPRRVLKLPVQGTTKRLWPGFVNAAGKLRQKW